MRQHITTGQLLVLLAMVLAARPGEAEEKKRPLIWSQVPYFHWIKQSSAPLDQYTFLINGGKMGTADGEVVKHKDSIHARFTLKNEKQTRIEVQHQGKSIFMNDVFYAPNYVPSSVIPEGATTLVFHTPDNEKRCEGCHRFTVTAADSSPSDITQQVCYPCHQRAFMPKKNHHAPATLEWGCPQCHQSEAVPSPVAKGKQVRFTVIAGADGGPICYDCHDGMQKKTKDYPFTHGPVAAGACVFCHDPHASDAPHFLQAETATLCVGCHRRIDLAPPKIVHPIISEEGCTACHRPHGSTAAKLLESPTYDLCIGCHSTIVDRLQNHPVKDHKAYIKPAGKKATPPGKKATPRLTCTNCHSPHATDHPKLLPEDGLMQVCVHCHKTQGL